MLITGKPTGFNEVWIIGDTHLLAKMKVGLDALKDSDAFTNMERRNLPFLLEYFEIHISQCHYSWAFTTQIRGGLASLLSSKWKLPNHIYIIFSNDQVEECDILGEEIYKVLNNLFTFVSRVLTKRKTQLPKKARWSNPPKVTAVKTVAKSQTLLNQNNFKIRRRTLNRAIQKVAQNFNWRAINIDTIVPMDSNNFDEYGDQLSAQGIKTLWRFISEDVRAAEANTTTISNASANQWSDNPQKHHKF